MSNLRRVHQIFNSKETLFLWKESDIVKHTIINMNKNTSYQKEVDYKNPNYSFIEKFSSHILMSLNINSRRFTALDLVKVLNMLFKLGKFFLQLIYS